MDGKSKPGNTFTQELTRPLSGATATYGTYDVAGGATTNKDYGGPTYSYDLYSTSTTVTDLSAGFHTTPLGVSSNKLLSIYGFANTSDPYRPTVVQDGNASANSQGAVLPTTIFRAGSSANVFPLTFVTEGYQASLNPNPQWTITYSTGQKYGNAPGLTAGSWGVNTSQYTAPFITPPSSMTESSTVYTIQVQYLDNSDNLYTYSGKFAVGNSQGTIPGLTELTWDNYGHVNTVLSPRGNELQVSYTDSTPVCLPTQFNELSGTNHLNPTILSYVAPGGTLTPPPSTTSPSDILQGISAPTPGTVYPSNSSVTTDLYYDFQGYGSPFPQTQGSLGNIVGISVPGNNSNNGASEYTYFNYTTDGTYNQSPCIGEPLTITDPSASVTHIRYDQYNNILSKTDALGNQTTYTYNIANQITSVTYPQVRQGYSQYVSYTYAYTGGPLIDEALFDTFVSNTVPFREVQFQYGPIGDLREVLAINHSSQYPTPSTQILAEYAYDGLFRTAAVEDGKLNTTKYQYNPQGYLCNVAYPGAGSTPPTDMNGLWNGADTVRYTSFDNDGNPLTRMDGRGVTTTYTYNESESLTGTAYSTIPSNVTYPLGSLISYDAFGRISIDQEGEVRHSYSYDDDGNVTGITKLYLPPSGDPVFTASWANQYWNDGSLQQKIINIGSPVNGSYPNGSYLFWYAYDGVGRLTEVDNDGNPGIAGGAQTTDYTYYPNGWLQTQLNYSTNRNNPPPVCQTDYYYNSRGFEIGLYNIGVQGQIESQYGATVASGQAEMTYDAAGNMLTMPCINNQYNALNGTTTYSYDLVNELKSESSTRDGGYSESYSYDTASNPTSIRGGSLTYNSDNEISNSGFAYDGDGNPTTYFGATLNWDTEDRFTGISGQLIDSNATADGTRAYSDSNYAGYNYTLYDGGNFFGAAQVSTSQPVLSQYGTYGANGLVSVTNTANLQPANFAYYGVYDPLGNQIYQNNPGDSTSYPGMVDAYGYIPPVQSAYTSVNPTASNAGTGAYQLSQDYENQLGIIGDSGNVIGSHPFYLMGQRDYDSTTGRFLNRDPIGYDGGLNLYAYCGNNLIGRINTGNIDSNETT